MSNPAVNYVWISKEPIKAGQEPIPLRNLERAFDNAERYPNASFIVWSDSRMIDECAQSTLADIFNKYAPDNMISRDLRDIPFYNACPIFNSGQFDIWAKVDLARLVVLEHGFYTLPHDTMFYADFDLENVRVSDPEITALLDEYGMVFGATREEAIENGYMGFRGGAGRSFLIEKLIPNTLVDTSLNGNGFPAMLRSLKEWSGSNDFGSFYHLAIEVLEPRGYKITAPLRRDYTGLGLTHV